MSKRWGVWSRLFIVLGVLWMTGFPTVMWMLEQMAASDRYSAGLQICYDFAKNGAAELDACLADQKFIGPGFDVFWGMAGVALILMVLSIALFLLVRTVTRWVLAGRNAAK